MDNELLQAISDSATETVVAVEKWLKNRENLADVVRLGQVMTEVLKAGGKLMACGNGGSLCQAAHFAEELTGRYRNDREPLGAIALSDAAHMSCVANDFGYAEVFSRAVRGFGRAGDGLLLLSTSGNSANLLAAAKTAKSLGISTFALLGKDGGKLKNQCDYEICVPGSTSDVIQNLHMIIIHLWIETIEREIFPANYTAKTTALLSH